MNPDEANGSKHGAVSHAPLLYTIVRLTPEAESRSTLALTPGSRAGLEPQRGGKSVAVKPIVMLIKHNE